MRVKGGEPWRNALAMTRSYCEKISSAVPY